MKISGIIFISYLFPLAVQEKSDPIESFRSDVIAFISDDLNASRMAEERLIDSGFGIPLLPIQHRLDLNWMDSTVETELTLKLNPYIESSRTIFCALELLSRSPKIDGSTREAILKILNNIRECNFGTRVSAFKTLCYATPVNESVFKEVEDVGFTFDLYNSLAIIDSNPNENLLFKYQGFAMVVDDLASVVTELKRDAVEVLSVVERLKTCESRAEKVFYLYWLLSMHGHSELFRDEVEVLQKDRNDDVRFLSTLLLICCSEVPNDTEKIVEAGNLKVAHESQLKDLIKGIREDK